MPSQLIGLFRTLTWNDFTGTPDASSSHLAFTSTKRDLPNIMLSNLNADSITITIRFLPSSSWKKMSQINSKKKRTPEQILKHEQGHYDLVALLARDLFIELMQLKNNQYKNQVELNKDVKLILDRHNDAVQQKLMDVYDRPNESDHGEDPGGQDRWNAMIQEAFHTPRVPAMSSPTGKTYKMEILKILGNNGITL